MAQQTQRQRRRRVDLMEELMARTSGSEYEDEGSNGSGDDDGDGESDDASGDNDDGDETESELERSVVKREFATSDDSDGSDESDESDESDDNSETEDEKSPSQPLLEHRDASSAEVVRAARYEAEERAIVVKEERGVRDLFGDDDYDDEDDDGGDSKDAAYSSSDELKESLFSSPEDDEGEAVDEKEPSFTESLLASGGEVSAPHDGGEPEDEDPEATEEKPLLVNDAERYEAKSVLWNVLAHVSQREKAALRRGQRVDGPPIENSIAHGDEFKRKFRWPVRLMNLPTTDFAQDPVEVYNDYEVALSSRSPPARRGRQQPRRLSAFAQVPRPIVEAVAAAAASTQRQSRKRKRPQPEAPPGAASPAALTAIARVGERFADELLESLVSANAAALQGASSGYSQRSWTPLPVSRKPVANWRFVLENVLQQQRAGGGGAEGGRSSASLRPETLERIRERLKTINALPWKPEDSELLASPSAPAEHGAGAAASTTGANVLIL